MKAVVDTNVIAYHLLQTEPHVGEVRQFWRAVSKPIAPASWKAELANTVWLNIQHGGLDRDVGLQRLRDVLSFGIESVDPSDLWEAAITRAVDVDHPAYDTLFVELAVRESVPLATFDQRILELFPQVAKRPKDIVD